MENVRNLSLYLCTMQSFLRAAVSWRVQLTIERRAFKQNQNPGRLKYFIRGYQYMIKLPLWKLRKTITFITFLEQKNFVTYRRAPSSFKNLITEKRTAYNLRGNFNLSIPKVNTTRYGLKSWRYAAAKYWNILPRDIRSMAGSKEFLKKIRQTDFHV